LTISLVSIPLRINSIQRSYHNIMYETFSWTPENMHFKCSLTFFDSTTFAKYCIKWTKIFFHCSLQINGNFLADKVVASYRISFSQCTTLLTTDIDLTSVECLSSIQRQPYLLQLILMSITKESPCTQILTNAFRSHTETDS